MGSGRLPSRSDQAATVPSDGVADRGSQPTRSVNAVRRRSADARGGRRPLEVMLDLSKSRERDERDREDHGGPDEEPIHAMPVGQDAADQGAPDLPEPEEHGV